MIAAERRERFLAYVEQSCAANDKSRVLDLHYDAIRREMTAAGVWRPAMKLLDVGCGVGRYSEFWSARGFNVIGLDCEQDLIAQARTNARLRGQQIRFEVGSADRLPFPDRSFDLVYANSLLEHVPNWQTCLDEWVRVLAPGGLLWVETTNRLCPRQGEYRWVPLFGWWPGWAKHLIYRLANGPYPAIANYSPCPALHWFSYSQLKKLLEARGLIVRDRIDCLDVARASRIKRILRGLARSSPALRWGLYLFLTPLVILARRPMQGRASATPQSA